ncbi:MAG TPA: hypothetical protein VLC46_17770 [Thermoanaerobaculia bacterium]|nr:hypothetical protein [Thermoanaerobaculia bacterium]
MSFAAACFVASTLRAQSPPVHLQTVTVDCWTNTPPKFCNNAALDPSEWDFSTINLNTPWSTTCTYTDPLPQASAVLAIQAIPWAQYCGDDFTTHASYATRLDGENGDIPAVASDDGFHCACDDIVGSFVNYTGKNYHPGDANTLDLFGDGNAAYSMRLYRVDLSILYTDAAPKYSVQVGFETPGTAPALFTKVTTSAPLTLQVPLGAVFTVGLQKTTALTLIPTPLNAIFGAGVSTVQPAVPLMPTATVMPVVQTLFADHSLVQVDNDDVSATKRFIAVHFGTTPITMTPVTSADDPQRQINVEVILPTDLGTSEHSFSDGSNDLDLDDYVSNVAHNTGIPPQYLKGQVHQEEYLGRYLVADNWRYEPVGSDLEDVSGGARRAYTDADFSPFRLDDAIGVTLHPGVQDELDPRNVFFLRRVDPATGSVVDRRISDADRGVTAREIWDDNDSVTGNGHIRMNFSLFASQAVLASINAPNSTVLDFVAQTPTASSSGLMQVMWDEAVDDDLWSGVTIPGSTNPVHEPKYVFDRRDYINIGGGSLQIGANKDVQDWRGGTVTKFPSLDAFEAAINLMMRYYNFKWHEGPVHYGDRVVTYSRSAGPAVPAVPFP